MFLFFSVRGLFAAVVRRKNEGVSVHGVVSVLSFKVNIAGTFRDHGAVVEHLRPGDQVELGGLF